MQHYVLTDYTGHTQKLHFYFLQVDIHMGYMYVIHLMDIFPIYNLSEITPSKE